MKNFPPNVGLVCNKEVYENYINLNDLEKLKESSNFLWMEQNEFSSWDESPESSIKVKTNLKKFTQNLDAIIVCHGSPKITREIIDNSKSRTLSIDMRSFSKANFWAVPWKDDYIIFAGRTLSKNAAALIANDYQWAKELFEGIFEITDGDEFMTKSRAVTHRKGDIFTISEIGVVQIPIKN